MAIIIIQVPEKPEKRMEKEDQVGEVQNQDKVFQHFDEGLLQGDRKVLEGMAMRGREYLYLMKEDRAPTDDLKTRPIVS